MPTHKTPRKAFRQNILTLVRGILRPPTCRSSYMPQANVLSALGRSQNGRAQTSLLSFIVLRSHLLLLLAFSKTIDDYWLNFFRDVSDARKLTFAANYAFLIVGQAFRKITWSSKLNTGTLLRVCNLAIFFSWRSKLNSTYFSTYITADFGAKRYNRSRDTGFRLDLDSITTIMIQDILSRQQLSSRGKCERYCGFETFSELKGRGFHLLGILRSEYLSFEVLNENSEENLVLGPLSSRLRVGDILLERLTCRNGGTPVNLKSILIGNGATDFY